MNNFSLIEKIQSFTIEDLIFVGSNNKIRTMINIPYPEKVNQVHFRQRLYVTNIKGIIVLSNKKKTVGKDRQDDIDRVIDEIKVKIKLNLIEIAKFKAASIIDKDPLIPDFEGFTNLIKDRSPSDIEEVLKQSVQESVYTQLMSEILFDNSEFFTNFVAEVLRVSATDEVIALLQSVAEKHGYKLKR